VCVCVCVCVCVYWQKGARGDEKRGMRVEWGRGVDGECVCGCMGSRVGREWAEDAESGSRGALVAERGASGRVSQGMWDDEQASVCVCESKRHRDRRRGTSFCLLPPMRRCGCAALGRMGACEAQVFQKPITNG
jgi:hypothetical protein